MLKTKSEMSRECSVRDLIVGDYSFSTDYFDNGQNCLTQSGHDTLPILAALNGYYVGAEL